MGGRYLTMADFKLYLYIVLYAAVSTYPSQGFLLTSVCPASSPCTCSGSSGSYININCNSKSLTSVPTFNVYNTTVTYYRVYLHNNKLATVTNNAFRNLSSINATGSIELRLENNNIFTIEPYAFNGFENVTYLNLANNNLSSLPVALKRLTHLQTLNLDNNPIRSLDSSLMSILGRTLTNFNVDLKLFTEWPSSMHYLSSLQTLNVDFIPAAHLDMNAFHSFQRTLTSLTMSYSTLEKVPYAVCTLEHLISLALTNDMHLKENQSSVFEPCGHTIPTMRTFTIDNNNLQKFPEVFTLFPMLSTLNARSNRFQYISNSVVPSGLPLSAVYLGNNLFERIPFALNKLKQLQTIYLDGNKIRTVETSDVHGLPELRTLYLTGNPIIYIAENSFTNNKLMSRLDIDGTQLDHVPAAVTHIPKLTTLYLSGRPFECTCDMSYLKHWNVSAINYISTTCASSNEPLKTYLLTTLQHCP